MQFSAVVLAIASTAFAQSATYNAIEAGLTSINTATGELNTAIQSFQGVEQTEAVLGAANGVVSAISTASSNLQPLPQMGPTELGQALELIPLTEQLSATVGTTIDSLIAKKQAFVDACEGPIVLQQLNGQKTASVAFIALVSSKTPQGTESIVSEQAQPILDNLDRGIAAFADQTSTPPSCGATPSSIAVSSAVSSIASSVASVLPTSAPAVPTTIATLPTGIPETCLPTTTTVTVTVPFAPTGAIPSATPVKPTFVPGKPTPTPPPQFTGAAVANGAAFGGFAAAGLAMLAVF